MHNPTAGVHKEETGTDPIKRIAECCGFDRCAIHHLADQRGPAYVRDDQLQALAH